MRLEGLSELTKCPSGAALELMQAAHTRLDNKCGSEQLLILAAGVNNTRSVIPGD